MKIEKPIVKDTLRLYWRAGAKYPLLASASLLLPVGAVLLTVAVPFYAGKVLAGALQPGHQIGAYLWALGIAGALGLVANRIGFTRFMVLQARSMADLHAMVFNRLLQRSVGFHANRVSGKLVSDALDFSSAYASLTNSLYITGIPFLLSIIIGLIVVAANSWQLGLYVFFIVSVTLVWAAIESQKRSSMRSIRLVATKKLTAHLADSIVNAQTVKTFSQEKAEKRRNKELNDKLEILRLNDWQRAGRSGNTRTGALLVMQFFMLLLIIHVTHENPAALGTGIFAFTYTLALSNRLYEINNLTRLVEEAFLQATPMSAMLREPIEIQDVPGAGSLTVTRGALDINHVTFSYAESSKHTSVFHGLTLAVTPGEKIGLVGPSGGGKSTFTRLLLRFDDIQDGTIAIDGQDIAHVTQASLRQSIAYVPQEPLLFHRTIRENIAYGRPDVTEKLVAAAAKKANAHDFIQGLSSGYDTIVGERGVKLSGGQRQRVAIARAILKDAPILVLDEATSALDSESEVLIQQALWQLMKNRTAIVIAHRLSTIQKMDRIIVLDNGQIVEEGTHKQLLAKNGLYAKLWSHQSGGFIEE